MKAIVGRMKSYERSSSQDKSVLFQERTILRIKHIRQMPPCPVGYGLFPAASYDFCASSVSVR